jgi:hypothetical protein
MYLHVWHKHWIQGQATSRLTATLERLERRMADDAGKTLLALDELVLRHAPDDEAAGRAARRAAVQAYLEAPK